MLKASIVYVLSPDLRSSSPGHHLMLYFFCDRKNSSFHFLYSFCDKKNSIRHLLYSLCDKKDSICDEKNSFCRFLYSCCDEKNSIRRFLYSLCGKMNSIGRVSIASDRSPPFTGVARQASPAHLSEHHDRCSSMRRRNIVSQTGSSTFGFA